MSCPAFSLICEHDASGWPRSGLELRPQSPSTIRVLCQCVSGPQRKASVDRKHRLRRASAGPAEFRLNFVAVHALNGRRVVELSVVAWRWRWFVLLSAVAAAAMVLAACSTDCRGAELTAAGCAARATLSAAPRLQARAARRARRSARGSAPSSRPSARRRPRPRSSRCSRQAEARLREAFAALSVRRPARRTTSRSSQLATHLARRVPADARRLDLDGRQKAIEDLVQPLQRVADAASTRSCSRSSRTASAPTRRSTEQLESLQPGAADAADPRPDASCRRSARPTSAASGASSSCGASSRAAGHARGLRLRPQGVGPRPTTAG